MSFTTLCIVVVAVAHLVVTGIAETSTNRVTVTDSTGIARDYPTLERAFEGLNSGETLRIYGRHVVAPDSGGGAFGPLVAPLQLVAKTNIVIQGAANAQIYGEGPGDFLAIEACQQIRVESISFSSNHPAAGRDPQGLYAMILLRGTNQDITISRCRFTNFGNHGISHLWDPKVSTHVTISECAFEGGGAVDVPILGADGAAVSGIGSDWTISGCSVTDCVRGFEIENGADNLIENVRILNNTLVGIKDLGVMLFVSNHDGRKFADIEISGNSFKHFNFISLSASAIRLAGGQRIQIRNNIVSDIARQGITVLAEGSVSDIALSGNAINLIGNAGILLQRLNSEFQTANLADNRVSFCGEAGIRIVDVADATVTGNNCFNNGLYVSAGGIELTGQQTERALLRGNKCFDLQDPKTQAYGILVGTNLSGAMLRDNYCLNNQAVIAGIQDNGSQTDLGGNKTVLAPQAANRSLLITAALVNAPPSATISLQPDGSVVLSWPTTASLSYAIDYKTSLIEPSWTSLSKWLSNGASTASVSDSISSGTSRYYRIRALQPGDGN